MKKEKLFNVKRNRRIFYTLACIVVFVTTYMLVLPALTIDEQTAIDDPAISNETLTQEEVNELETVADPFEIEQEREAALSGDTDQTETITSEGLEETAEETAPLSVSEETSDGFSFEYISDTISVFVTAPSEAFPQGTTMKVTPMTADEVMDSVNDALDSNTKAKNVVAVDIKFFDVDGNEIQPACDIKVSMVSGMIKDAENTEVVHIDNEGKGTLVDQSDEDSDEDEIIFETKDFSPYVVVETETIETEVITANGETYRISVTYGPEAGIPEGSVLEVREILKDTEEYQKYLEEYKKAYAEKNQKIDSEEIEEDEENIISFARFFDIQIISNGEKIEPEAAVEVSIKYRDAIKLNLNESLNVVHFAEDGTELIEADLSENDSGITDITFTQDSFSVSGTVVQYLSTGWPANGDYVMIVKPNNSNNYYAVKNDGELTRVNYNANTQKVEFSDLTSLAQVDNYWWTKSNSNYNGWHYIKAKNGANYFATNQSSALSTSQDSVARDGGNLYNVSGYYSYTYNYLLVNETSLKIVGQGDDDSPNRAVVLFANDFSVDESLEPEPTEVDLGAPAVGKNLINNNDGTYQLALSVTGKSQAQETHSKADIIIIFDRSGSMRYRGTSSTVMNDYGEGRRDYDAIQATKGLVSMLLANNQNNPDAVEISIVQFNNAASTVRENSKNETQLLNDIDGLRGQYNTGTNWEAAFKEASKITTREGAAKYVIFVSDGNPSFHVTYGAGSEYYDQENGYYIYGTGTDTNDTNVRISYVCARDDAKNLVDNGYNFYTLAVFDDNVDRMSRVTAYAYTGSDGTGSTYPEGHYQSAANKEALNRAFASIINDINKNFTYTDVEIDDGITALTATALVTGTVNNYEYKITYIDDTDSQRKTVNITPNANGTISIPSVTYGVKQSDGSIKSVTTQAVTVKGATYDGEKVIWELDKSNGEKYKLENGWTYEVSFTVWPTQRAYDLVSDLANGTITYNELTAEEKASIDQATLTLKTNTEFGVTYRQIVTTNGVDSEPSDPKTVTVPNPPSVPLTKSFLKIEKHWNDDLDPTQLLDLLTDNLNAAGTDVNYTVVLDVMEDKGTSAAKPVHTADYPNGFIFKPTVTIENGKVTSATWPEIDIAVAPGIMMTYEHAHAHGFDTAVDSQGNPKYETVTYNGTTYYVIEKGHRYEITERDTDYHFEMESNVDHLMIIDGILKNVIFNDAGTQIIDISENLADLTELVATNNLKGGINLYKYVEDTEGNRITPKDDVFTVKCTLLDKDDHPFTRTSETVGDDENDGIVYRVYAPDEELETLYPGKVETGRNRTIKIGVLDSSEFNVQLKAGWYIRFINVPGDTHWTFEEINIPTGYEIDMTGTEVVDGQTVLKTRGLSGTAKVNTANEAQITNTMTGFETRLLKIEAGTGIKDPETGEYTTQPVKLGGVKFIISNNNEGADNGKYLNISDGNISWVSDKDAAQEFTTDTNGVVSFGTLPLGKYKLIETETKAGYVLLTEEVSFELAGDGITYQINSVSEPIKAKKITVIEDGKTIVYSIMEIPNSAGTVLPHTGGSGTSRYYLFGSMLIVGSLLYEYSLRRNSRKRKEVK